MKSIYLISLEQSLSNAYGFASLFLNRENRRKVVKTDFFVLFKEEAAKNNKTNLMDNYISLGFNKSGF